MKTYLAMAGLSLIAGAALALHHDTPYPYASLWSVVVGLACFWIGRLSKNKQVSV